MSLRPSSHVSHSSVSWGSISNRLLKVLTSLGFVLMDGGASFCPKPFPPCFLQNQSPCWYTTMVFSWTTTWYNLWWNWTQRKPLLACYSNSWLNGCHTCSGAVVRYIWHLKVITFGRFRARCHHPWFMSTQQSKNMIHITECMHISHNMLGRCGPTKRLDSRSEVDNWLTGIAPWEPLAWQTDLLHWLWWEWHWCLFLAVHQ